MLCGDDNKSSGNKQARAALPHHLLKKKRTTQKNPPILKRTKSPIVCASCFPRPPPADALVVVAEWGHAPRTACPQRAYVQPATQPHGGASFPFCCLTKKKNKQSKGWTKASFSSHIPATTPSNNAPARHKSLLVMIILESAARSHWRGGVVGARGTSKTYVSAPVCEY